MFVDRRIELDWLSERHEGRGAELLVLYGRRRTGKSALLQQFCKGRPHVYFVASQVRETDNLDQFRQVLAATHSDPVLNSMRFNSWETALAYVAQLAARRRLVVVLDEFPYLCQSNRALPSLLQRWWDMQGRSSQIMLILCGSQISFMERDVLAERSPLFGRRTGQLQLLPLLPWHAALFFPRWTVRDRLSAYGMLGGIPAYLERFDARQSLRANLLREALRPQGFLYDEVTLLLRTELADVSTYLSVLKAVAGGATRITEIATRAGIPTSATPPYLRVLRDLQIVRRDVPFTEPNPHKSKRGVYVVTDPFVSFWSRFILPHQSLIQAGQGATVWRQFIKPHLDTHLGFVFEEICRQYVLHRWAETHGETPVRVGRVWASDQDLDVVADLRSGKEQRLLVGECKWWRKPVGANVLRRLQRAADHLPLTRGKSLRFALFSLSGFTNELKSLAAREDVVLVSENDLLASE